MRKISWKQISKLCQKLAQELKQCGQEFSCIYAIPRGGLPGGVHLSHLTGIRMKFDTFNPEQSQYIVLDDINDTGRTMRPHVENEKATTVVLFEREDSEVKADYVGEYIKHNDWIIFPWEDPDNAFDDMVEYLEEGERHAVYKSRQT